MRRLWKERGSSYGEAGQEMDWPDMGLFQIERGFQTGGQLEFSKLVRRLQTLVKKSSRRTLNFATSNSGTVKYFLKKNSRKSCSKP